MKMQRVAPEIKAIQEKYKKYKINDPRKAEMNQEVMAVYKREGINPAGGCFQMLVQMPIWIGLNRALGSAIEMRHAPWFWLDQGSFGARSLLHLAGDYGRHDVSADDDNAHDHYRSSAADDDEVYATFLCGYVLHHPFFERARGVHYDWQFDRRSPAVVSKPGASG